MNFSLPFPPREFPDRGTKWLLGHPAHLRHLLRILATDISDRLDFDRLAPVPNELLSESLRRQLADLVFTAPFQDEAQGEVTIFILVEHQSTPSPVMRLRVLLALPGARGVRAAGARHRSASPRPVASSGDRDYGQDDRAAFHRGK